MSTIAITLLLSTSLSACVTTTEGAPTQRPSQHSQKELQSIIYKNVALIDGVGDSVRHNMSVIVLGEKITAVIPTSELTNQQTQNTKIIDASGWYAIPGLVESHTHIATEPNRQFAEFILNRQLYGGITTARDLAGDARALADLSRASLVKEIPAPDLKYVALMAGPGFFKDPRTISSGRGVTPGKISWMQGVTETSDMKKAVAYARGTWATAIKTYAALDARTIQLIADEARRQGVLVWSHVNVGPAGPIDVARAGVRTMSHISDVCAAAIPADVKAKSDRGEMSGFVDVDINSPKIDAVFAEMKRQNTVLDATLRLFVQYEKQESAMLKQAQRLAKEQKENSKTSSELDEEDNKRRRRGVRAKCGSKEGYVLARRAYKMGVKISTGTDGWNGSKDAFPALYDELRLLNEEVGMPMIDVIKASAVNGAYSVGMENEAGTISPGKLANIMFLKENPLDGVDSFKSVVLTVKRGTPYYRKDFKLGSPGDIAEMNQ